MDTAPLSLSLNAVLAVAALLLLGRLIAQNRRVSALGRDAAFAEGFEAGRISILDSIRYEREVFECRRVGLVRKETALKVREAVYLGKLRIAQAEHEVVLASEVNQENLWGLVDHATQAAVGPEVTNVIRKLAPGVQKLITAAAKPA